jgi:hypothetical protein
VNAGYSGANGAAWSLRRRGIFRVTPIAVTTWPQAAS